MDERVEGGWILVGRAGSEAVRLVFGESQLRASHLGLAIGRHPALCERVIDEPSISRRHARLALDGRRLVVEDLNSLNGTSIDGAPLAPFEPQEVDAGQTLSLGGVDLELRELDDQGSEGR